MNPVPFLQLMHISGIGHATLNRLIRRMENQGISPEDLHHFSSDDLVYLCGFRPEWVHPFRTNHEQAEQTFEKLYSQGIQIVIPQDEFYPQRLSHILGNSAPPMLFVRGNRDLLRQKGFAIVGARKCSDQGIQMAQTCAAQVVEQSITVSRGNAPGIDTIAHTTALSEGGNTVFILAHGIFHFRPCYKYSQPMQAESSLVVSEFLPGLPWATHAAMQRNRTICALAQAVIVIEAGVSGGSIATARLALQFHIPLFAAAYTPMPPTAEGNRYLLHRGAIPIQNLPNQIRDGLPRLNDRQKLSPEGLSPLLFPEE